MGQLGNPQKSEVAFLKRRIRTCRVCFTVGWFAPVSHLAPHQAPRANWEYLIKSFDQLCFLFFFWFLYTERHGSTKKYKI